MADHRFSVPLLAAAALLMGGCAVNHSNTDLVAGKQAFVKTCGSCHTLSHAGTTGTVGPNLDQAFREDVREHFGTSAVAGVVRGQIANPGKYPVGHVGTAMPPGLAHGATAENIAAYVASVVGRPGKDQGLLATAVASAGGGKPAVEKAGVLELDADPGGQLSYTTKKATATAGKVTIKMANMSGTSHNLAIQVGTGASGMIVAKTPFTAKGTVSASATLKAGTYTFFCQVPGHRAGGMFGTLTVK
jgi:plastocyanin